MSSQIDPTVIQDNVKVDKADLRDQLAIAASEITDLQHKVNVPRRMMYDDAQFDTI